MSHHANDYLANDANDAFINALKNKEFGATGKFPDGKIHESDEGQIKFGLTVNDNKIILSFGKPTAWIGFTKDEATQLANTILERIRQID